MASQRKVRIAITVAGSLLGLGGLTLVGVGLAGQQPAPPAAHEIPAETIAPSSTPDSPASARPTSPTRSTTSKPKPKAKLTPSGPAILAESVPAKITIPAIDVSSRFVDLGLTDQGEVDAPKDPADVGWYTGAHTPGSPGVAVVAGHVTWNRVPSVFFKLGKLARGDKITIKRKDGSSAVFAVSRMSTYPKTEFPTKEVYRDVPDPELILITCGGKYVTDQHYYDSNVIVWATLVSTHPA